MTNPLCLVDNLRQFFASPRIHTLRQLHLRGTTFEAFLKGVDLGAWEGFKEECEQKGLFLGTPSQLWDFSKLLLLTLCPLFFVL